MFVGTSGIAVPLRISGNLNVGKVSSSCVCDDKEPQHSVLSQRQKALQMLASTWQGPEMWSRVSVSRKCSGPKDCTKRRKWTEPKPPQFSASWMSVISSLMEWRQCVSISCLHSSFPVMIDLDLWTKNGLLKVAFVRTREATKTNGFERIEVN